MYREHGAPPGAGEVIACSWDRSPGADGRQLVLPDGCVDLVRFADGRLVVAGPDTGPWRSPVRRHEPIAGVRLRPGAAAAVLGLPAAELRDRRVDARELAVPWLQDRRLGERLAAAPAGRRRAILVAAVHARGAAPDPLVQAAVRRLQARPGLRVDDLAADLGVGERQLHRRSLHTVGYGPKVLARVARLHRFLGLADRLTAADAALAAGYAGQSHLGDEFRRLTGATPVRFLEDRAGRRA